MFILNHRFSRGAHRGRHLTDSAVPVDYLAWVLRRVSDLTKFEHSSVLGELRRRGVRDAEHMMCDRNHDSAFATCHRALDSGSSSDVFTLPRGVDPQTALLLITAGRRELARRLHPDAGGDSSQMVAVNAAAAALETDLYRLIASTGQNGEVA